MRKDREARRAYCAKVRSEKAAIDKARLELTAGWRDMTKQANEAGKEINTRLEALAIEKRATLTEWEEAEKAREAEVEKIMAMFRSERFVPMGDGKRVGAGRGVLVRLVLGGRRKLKKKKQSKAN